MSASNSKLIPPVSCSEGSFLVRAYPRIKKNKTGEPYIQHVENYCRIKLPYFDEFCKTENPENPDLVYAMLTVFGEARGESENSIKAIAWVIRNRLNRKKWGKTYKELVLKEKQFDCWKNNDPNYKAILKITKQDKKEQSAWEKCKKIIKEIQNAPEENNPLPQVYNYFSGLSNSKISWQKKYFDLPNIPHFHFVKLKYP